MSKRDSERRKYKTGLVIGRFQPFHLGHKYLIEEALKYCEKIVIGIGSANKNNDINPWDSSKRRKMLVGYVKHEKLEDRVISIVDLYDNPDDDMWFDNLLRKTGSFDVTLGNNAWNNGIIERHGIPVMTIGFYKRNTLEGTKIRDLMQKKKKWESRVPQYLVEAIRKTS